MTYLVQIKPQQEGPLDPINWQVVEGKSMEEAAVNALREGFEFWRRLSFVWAFVRGSRTTLPYLVHSFKLQW